MSTWTVCIGDQSKRISDPRSAVEIVVTAENEKDAIALAKMDARKMGYTGRLAWVRKQH